MFADQVQEFFGSDEINPPVALGPFSFSSWSEVSQICGDSRVWGGMHFKVRDRQIYGSRECGASLETGPNVSGARHGVISLLLLCSRHPTMFSTTLNVENYKKLPRNEKRVLDYSMALLSQ